MTIETPPIPPQHQNSQPGLQTCMDPQPLSVNPRYKPSGKLCDQVAFITGGDSGIGRSVALHYILEGAKVAIGCHPTEMEDAQDTRQMALNPSQLLVQSGGINFKQPDPADFLIIPADLADEKACRQSIRKVLEHFGRIDILVLNAAVQHVNIGGIQEISSGRLEHLMRVNVFADFYLIQELMTSSSNQNTACSSIIITSSVQAYKGKGEMLEYTVSKGALVAMVRGLSLTLGPSIRVNGVAPGPIWTPLIASTFEPEALARFGQEVPMKRYGQPAECGPCFVFLASDDASYITGQFLHPNGGVIVNG